MNRIIHKSVPEVWMNSHKLEDPAKVAVCGLTLKQYHHTRTFEGAHVHWCDGDADYTKEHINCDVCIFFQLREKANA